MKLLVETLASCTGLQSNVLWEDLFRNRLQLLIFSSSTEDEKAKVSSQDVKCILFINQSTNQCDFQCCKHSEIKSCRVHLKSHGGGSALGQAGELSRLGRWRSWVNGIKGFWGSLYLSTLSLCPHLERNHLTSSILKSTRDPSLELRTWQEVSPGKFMLDKFEKWFYMILFHQT